MKQILTQITNGEVLTREQTRQFIHGVVDGQYNDVQVSALLTGLIMRGIKVNELLGLRDGLIETGNPVDFSPYRVMDIVGTGGDHKNTFNISTCACLVVAGAGYYGSHPMPASCAATWRNATSPIYMPRSSPAA